MVRVWKQPQVSYCGTAKGESFFALDWPSRDSVAARPDLAHRLFSDTEIIPVTEQEVVGSLLRLKGWLLRLFPSLSQSPVTELFTDPEIRLSFYIVDQKFEFLQ